MNDYAAFVERKRVRAAPHGLDDMPPLAPHLFPFQRHCVEFGLRVGGSGLFLDTGLGKTLCELEWATHASAATNGRALILTPLAVAWQIKREADRFGYDARVIREQADAREGINICNYDRLDKLDMAAFGAIALDESSILKAFTGVTTRKLIEGCAGHRFKLCATATPAPNDHMEIGQHGEFLSIMPSNEMLMRWFIADQTEMGRYRLKGHAAEDFWDWMTSWAIMAERPSDLGDSDERFQLPELNVIRHRLRSDKPIVGEGLFAEATINATTMHDIKRQTAEARAEKAALLALGDDEPWVIWVDTNYEADAIVAAFDGAPVVEIRGSMNADEKEGRLREFATGAARVLVTKPSIAGFGLNWQHCANMAFVGRSFSYETWYQAIRRCWRFGQQRAVQVHLIVAEGEDTIGRVIDRKSADHIAMKMAMTKATRRAIGIAPAVLKGYAATHEGGLPAWFSA